MSKISNNKMLLTLTVPGKVLAVQDNNQVIIEVPTANFNLFTPEAVSHLTEGMSSEDADYFIERSESFVCGQAIRQRIKVVSGAAEPKPEKSAPMGWDAIK